MWAGADTRQNMTAAVTKYYAFISRHLSRALDGAGAVRRGQRRLTWGLQPTLSLPGSTVLVQGHAAATLQGCLVSEENTDRTEGPWQQTRAS